MRGNGRYINKLTSFGEETAAGVKSVLHRKPRQLPKFGGSRRLIHDNDTDVDFIPNELLLPDSDDMDIVKSNCEGVEAFVDIADKLILGEQSIRGRSLDVRMQEDGEEHKKRRCRAPCVIYGLKLRHLYKVVRNFIRDENGMQATDAAGEIKFTSISPYLDLLWESLNTVDVTDTVQAKTPSVIDIDSEPFQQNKVPRDELRTQTLKLIGGSIWPCMYQCGKDIEGTPLIELAAEKLVEVRDTDNVPYADIGWMMLGLNIDTWNQAHGTNLPNAAGAWEIHTRPPVWWKKPRRSNLG